MAKSARRKAPDALRTIGEAAAELGLPTHVLRFWETKFPVLKPIKRADGRRSYRPEDVTALKAIKLLVHDQGMTLKGAADLLKAKGVASVLDGGGVTASKPTASFAALSKLKAIRDRLAAVG